MNIPSHDGYFDLTDDLLSALKVKYPAVPVYDEMLKANLWLHKNPARRPKLMLRFLEKWLSKCKIKPVKIHLVNGKMTESEILALGRQKGLDPRPGESYEKFLQRLRA